MHIALAIDNLPTDLRAADIETYTSKPIQC
jgi:hypothetical protein